VELSAAKERMEIAIPIYNNCHSRHNEEILKPGRAKKSQPKLINLSVDRSNQAQRKPLI
jgi:hypothetical protein